MELRRELETKNSCLGCTPRCCSAQHYRAEFIWDWEEEDDKDIYWFIVVLMLEGR